MRSYENLWASLHIFYILVLIWKAHVFFFSFFCCHFLCKGKCTMQNRKAILRTGSFFLMANHWIESHAFRNPISGVGLWLARRVWGASFGSSENERGEFVFPRSPSDFISPPAPWVPLPTHHLLHQGQTSPLWLAGAFSEVSLSSPRARGWG